MGCRERGRVHYMGRRERGRVHYMARVHNPPSMAEIYTVHNPPSMAERSIRSWVLKQLSLHKY